MKATPYLLIASGVVAVLGLLVAPWVSSRELSMTMLDIIQTHDHGYQLGYVLLGSSAIPIVVGVLSRNRSRRWLTALSALLVVPTALGLISHGAAIGARMCGLGGMIALLTAIVMTVVPVRPAPEAATAAA